MPLWWLYIFSKVKVYPVFSGNIANIIPGSPMKKMIPLMEDHGGGGCMGTPVDLLTNMFILRYTAA